MRIEIPCDDWTSLLPHAIQNAHDGDTIVCHSAAMREVGKRALSRTCPLKTVRFVIEDQKENDRG